MSTKRSRRSRLTGFVRERGNSRSLVVRIADKQYSKAVHTRTKREALDMLPAFIAEVQSGTFATAKEAIKARLDAPTFRKAAEAYIADYMRQDADGASTRRVYRHAFNTMANELGDIRLSEITETMLHIGLRRLHQSGRDGKGYSLASVQVMHAALSVFFNRMVRLKLIPASPLPTFKTLALGPGEQASERARRSALSSGQVSALIEACEPDKQVRVWALVMAATGARPGEALAICWQDIDLEHGILHIEHSAKGGRLGSTKSPGSRRTVPIGATLAVALQAERERQEGLLRQLHGLSDNVATVKPMLGPEDCVFPSGWDDAQRLAPVNLDSIRHRFKRAVLRAGLPPVVSPHWLRHGMLSAAIAGTDTQPGISIVDAAKIAGHANPTITAKVYAHAAEANMARGIALADAWLTAATPATVEPLRNAANADK